MTLGFVGTGTLTAAVVRAIRTQHGTAPDILLSPRSEAISRELAETLPNVVRTLSSADVVSASDTVVLAMRPQQFDEAVAGLPFRADQTVVSFLAGIPVADVAAKVAPARTVCRVTPLTTIALGLGPIVLHPVVPAVRTLFAPLGDVVEAADEAEMMALGCASGLLSTFFQVQATVAGWLERQGVPPDRASLYVRSMQRGLSETGYVDRVAGFPALVDAHETKAGLNARARSHLMDAGWFGEVETALDLLLRRTPLRSGGGA